MAKNTEAQKGSEKNKRTRSRVTIRPYYFALVTIAILLALLLVLIPKRSYEPGTAAAKEAPSGGISEKGQSSPAEAPGSAGDLPERPSGTRSPGQASPEATPEFHEITPAGVPEKVPKGSIAVVIDDVGNNIEQLQPFLQFPGPLTFAVLPRRTYSRQATEMIIRAGKSVILHQPMEPVGNENPGESAIYVGMGKDEIYSILDRNFAEVPGAVGMNNHMGSKATSDRATMEIVFEYLSEHGLSFIDSVTTAETVAAEMAHKYGVPYTRRNSMFLDNEDDEEAIRIAVDAGLDTAESAGNAVMIGHVMSSELADLLLEYYPDVLNQGYQVKDVYSLLSVSGASIVGETK